MKIQHTQRVLMIVFFALVFWQGDFFVHAQVSADQPRDLEELNRLLKGLTTDLQKSKNSQSVKDEIAPLLFPVNKDAQSLLAPQSNQKIPPKAEVNSPSTYTAPAQILAEDRDPYQTRSAQFAKINLQNLNMEFTVQKIQKDLLTVRDPRYYVTYTYKDFYEFEEVVLKKTIEVSMRGLEGGELDTYLAEKFASIEYSRKTALLQKQREVAGFFGENIQEADEHGSLSGKMFDSQLKSLVSAPSDTKQIKAQEQIQNKASKEVSESQNIKTEKPSPLSPKVPHVLPLLLF